MLATALNGIIDEHQIDYTIVNIENAAGGIGVTPDVLREMDALPIDERTQIIMVHSGLGTLVLVLLLVRLWWRRGHPVPGPTPNMSARQASLSTLMHRALYTLFILQVLFGIGLPGFQFQ